MVNTLSFIAIYIALSSFTTLGMYFHHGDCDIQCHYGTPKMAEFEQCVCSCLPHFTGDRCDEAYAKRCCERDDCGEEDQCPPNFYCETDAKMCLSDPQRCGSAYGWCVPLPIAELL